MLTNNNCSNTQKHLFNRIRKLTKVKFQEYQILHLWRQNRKVLDLIETLCRLKVLTLSFWLSLIRCSNQSGTASLNQLLEEKVLPKKVRRNPLKYIGHPWKMLTKVCHSSSSSKIKAPKLGIKQVAVLEVGKILIENQLLDQKIKIKLCCIRIQLKVFSIKMIIRFLLFKKLSN